MGVRHDEQTMSAARDQSADKSRTEVVWVRQRQAELSPELARVMDGRAFDVFEGEPPPARHQVGLF